jgi:hypothetical protein
MVGLEPAAVSLIPGAFILVVLWRLRSDLREAESRQPINEAPGFACIAPGPLVNRKLLSLYRPFTTGARRPAPNHCRLQNVATRRLMYCDVYIFDLLDTAGADATVIERQAVAVISPHLRLPTFLMFPRAEVDGPLARLGNENLGRLTDRFGPLVEFAHPDEFTARYLVRSPDPDATRQFLDARRLRQLARSRLLIVRAAGDAFVLSRIELPIRSPAGETLQQRVDLAIDVYSVLRAGS